VSRANPQMEQNESRPARLPEPVPNSAKKAPECAKMGQGTGFALDRFDAAVLRVGIMEGRKSIQPLSLQKEVVTGQRRSPTPPLLPMEALDQPQECATRNSQDRWSPGPQIIMCIRNRWSSIISYLTVLANSSNCPVACSFLH
jgi:hypothetical protein